MGAAVDAAGKATGAFTYGLMGTTGWFLNGAVGDVAVLVLFFFMMVFMDTTATIPDGRYGGTLVMEKFLFVRLLGRIAVLLVRQLGLGRRFARAGRY